MGGLIGIPNTDHMHIKAVESLLELDKAGASVAFIRGSALNLSREYIAEQVVKNNFEFLCFIDTDMVVPPNMLKQLLSHDLPFVSAMAFRKTEPFQPAFYEKCWVEKNVMKGQLYNLITIPENLFEVEAVGAACCVIRRDVFEKTERPWFAPYYYAGEDVSFCIRVRKAGFKIFVDPSLMVGHIGFNPVDVFTYLKFKQDNEELAGGKV